MSTEVQPQSKSTQDKRLEELVSAAILMNPELKDRLNLAAATQLMRLPDNTLGWTDGIASMNIEIKILSVLTHLRLGAIPGMKHLLWLKNGFYPTASYWTYRVRKDIESGILSPVTSQEFTLLTDDEMKMFGINPDTDRSCKVTETFKVKDKTMEWHGHGIIGIDELSKRDSKGNGMPGMQNLKNIMKTLKTRAVLDMYSRNWPVDGVTVSAEEMQDVIDSETHTPHNPEKIIELQSTPSKPLNMEQVNKDLAKSLELKLSRLYDKVVELGGEPDDICTPNHPTVVVIKELEKWIDEQNQNPEPPKPKRTRRTKEQMLADQAKPKEFVPEDYSKPKPMPEVPEVKLQSIEYVHPENYIAESAEEYPVDESIETDLTPMSDSMPSELSAFYTATEAQKQMIRNAVIEHDLPQTESILMALSGAMRGQQMYKLYAKAKAMVSTVKASDLPSKGVHPKGVKTPTTDDKLRLRNLITKLTDMGLDVKSIVDGREVWDIWDEGSASEVSWATEKLESEYKKILMRRKP